MPKLFNLRMSEHSGWEYNKMTGKLLRQYVIDELDFDPSFELS